MGEMIAILCPSRGRPEGFNRMMESALGTAKEPDNLRFMCYIDNDDPKQHSYPNNTKNLITFTGPPWFAVMASNYLAGKCKELLPGSMLYMVGADDMVFDTPHWDTAVTDAYGALENKIHVFSLKDSRSKRGTPHPILTKAYVDAMGYFLPPIFLHWYVDYWTVQIAKANGCFTHLTDYLLIHDKPSDRGLCDDTHGRIRMLGYRERDQYVNDLCAHFLESEKERLGRIIQQQMGIREHLD